MSRGKLCLLCCLFATYYFQVAPGSTCESSPYIMAVHRVLKFFTGVYIFLSLDSKVELAFLFQTQYEHGYKLGYFVNNKVS